MEPLRTITSTFFTSVFDVRVCSLDTLYVVDAAGGNIYIYNNASSLNGSVDPDLILNVLGQVY